MAETVKTETTPEEDYYKKTNDPNAVAKQATERKSAELLKQNALNRSNTALDYDSAYKGLRSNNFRNFKSALEGSQGLSGGMAQGRQDAMSALEMGALGNFMTGRQKAMNELDSQKAGIAGQAEEYGQLQREMSSANQQTDLARVQQIQSILNAKDSEISQEDKRAQLKTLGWTDAQIDEQLTPQLTWFQKLFQTSNNTPTPYGVDEKEYTNRANVPYNTGGMY